MSSENIYIGGGMESVGGNWNEPLFDHVAKKLRARGYNVLNPWDLTRELIGPLPKLLAMSKEEQKKTRKGLLAKELVWIINNADRVVLLPDWRRSPGATAEHAVATALNIPTYELPDSVSLMQDDVDITLDIDEPTAA
jgi:hypothetical protein